MKKLIGLLLVAIVFLFAPSTFAQSHGHGGQGHGGQSHGGGHVQQAHPQGHFRGDSGHHTNAEARSHYNGRHFDEGYRGHYFGRDHFFHVGHPVFYNGGYRFWYGGFWFGYDAWPYGWGYNDPVYIDYDGDVCYLYNPYHPGVRIIVNVF